jgi:hypothetical protein
LMFKPTPPPPPHDEQVAAELARHAAEPILYLGHPVQLRKPEGPAAGTWLERFGSGALGCLALLRRDTNAKCAPHLRSSPF